MVNKKNQVATEFLMTYGWAILVVLVCIGALAYFGIFDSFGRSQFKCREINMSYSNSIMNEDGILIFECYGYNKKQNTEYLGLSLEITSTKIIEKKEYYTKTYALLKNELVPYDDYKKYFEQQVISENKRKSPCECD
jgi:uncharacterized protein (UPF0333 family)